jgi:hypothetical protein
MIHIGTIEVNPSAAVHGESKRSCTHICHILKLKWDRCLVMGSSVAISELLQRKHNSTAKRTNEIPV